MLSPGGQSDRFLIAKDFKLVGCRREKYVFCYVVDCERFKSVSGTWANVHSQAKNDPLRPLALSKEPNKPYLFHPDDHIPPRRSALFMARSVLRGIRDGGTDAHADCIVRRARHWSEGPPNATTTPKVRQAIRESDEAGTVLAARFGVTPQTIYKWRRRDSVEDRSHTPHRLQTRLTPAQGSSVKQSIRGIDCSAERCR
jgi:transposase-like protein